MNLTESEIAALILGITEIVKQWGVPSKYCSAVAIALGVIISVADAARMSDQIDIYPAILKGLLIGVATTGSYAALDKFIAKSTEKNGNSSQETY